MVQKIATIVALIATMVVLGIFLYGCFVEVPTGNETANETGTTVEGVKKVVDANNRFSLELYAKLKDDPAYEEGNTFFSPYSISTALSMTYEGARGKTADEMRAVLHLPSNDSARRADSASIYNELNKKGKNYTLNTANALWAQKDYQFLSDYFDLVGQYYKGGVTNLDFVRDAEGSRTAINGWVENRTNSKIKDLIPPGTLGPLTRLVLTNAIYFKGLWAEPFDKNYTEEKDFRVSRGKSVKTPMMMKTARFNYAETEDLQVLELPYSGKEVSMLILLPKEGTLAAFERTLNAEKLAGLRSSLTEEKVEVSIPRFKFEAKYFMAGILKRMGMPTAFSANADFSGMTGEKDLFISQVIHQAFVEVNEEGTEAAAATAVVVVTSAFPGPQIKVFNADHPFIFIIQQRETGNILFLGKIIDPTSG